MFGRLVQKELLHYLLDFRFIAVFALCALLSVLSVYVGRKNYTRQIREYNAVSETNRRVLQEWFDKKRDCSKDMELLLSIAGVVK